jgi:hypothetical protein
VNDDNITVMEFRDKIGRTMNNCTSGLSEEELSRIIIMERL